MNLTSAPQATPLIVTTLSTSDQALIERLAVLGIDLGRVVRVQRNTPKGPVVVTAGSGNFALGAELAEVVQVELKELA